MSASSTCRALCLRCRPQTIIRSPSAVRSASTATPTRKFVPFNTASKSRIRQPLSRPVVPPERKQKRKTIPTTIAPQLSQEELASIYSQELFVFRSDVSATQVFSAMQSYPQLREIGVLTADDISNLARQIHSLFRKTGAKRDVAEYLDVLIQDCMTGAIPGHPLATVHIISCLKDMEDFDKATQFFQWLREEATQAYCDMRVYGSAIEMFAYKGEPLPFMEELWNEALVRWSGTTSLAVARDTGKGISVMLLQGIITARLFHKEWRGAYEGLDICLRLYPTLTPSRLYELFIYERPIREAYIVFLLACRAGQPPKATVLTPLLKETFRATHDPRALLRLVYNYVGAGGIPSALHLNCLIQSILTGCPPEELDKNLSYVRSLIAAFARVNVPPSTSTFNNLISLGGKLRQPALVFSAFKELLAAGLTPDTVTHRANLAAVAHLKEVDRLEATWKLLKEHKEATGRQWEGYDWHVFIKAAIACDNIPFFRKELFDARLELGPDQVAKINHRLSTSLTLNMEGNTPDEYDSSKYHSQSHQQMRAHIKALTDVFSSASTLDYASAYPDGDQLFELDPGSSPAMTDSRPDARESSLAETRPSVEELKEIYEKLTPAIHPATGEEATGTGTITGYDIATLRFENWRAINRLLFEAELVQLRFARKAAEQEIAMKQRLAWREGREYNSYVDEEMLRKQDLGYEKLFWNEEKAKMRVAEVAQQRDAGEDGWRKEEIKMRCSLVAGRETRPINHIKRGLRLKNQSGETLTFV
ncbi:hypothetical protein EX30DRAFT_338984 [Ascodesmis nigricans]|uniref:Pentatricopeptide repeat protein n=1 Tax=Ascodesmis nigricans TaxID=341454 RepID=A0A4S2N0P5_9PEZI|nr:hypothetical protein EX30DRAFT_338984 [Ascodesmis nigricans]